jgi:hypothetical protein
MKAHFSLSYFAENNSYGHARSRRCNDDWSRPQHRADTRLVAMGGGGAKRQYPRVDGRL